MNRGRNILKKTAAVAMSSSMILAGGSNVWAAGSYQETARASLQTLTESVAGAIDGYAQDVNRSLQGSKGTLTLKVEDIHAWTGRSDVVTGSENGYGYFCKRRNRGD